MAKMIAIPILNEKNTDRNQREIVVPVDLVCMEDWYGLNREEKVPNQCRVTINGNSYKAMLSRVDLEKQLTDLGVIIHRIKAT